MVKFHRFVKLQLLDYIRPIQVAAEPRREMGHDT